MKVLRERFQVCLLQQLAGRVPQTPRAPPDVGQTSNEAAAIQSNHQHAPCIIMRSYQAIMTSERFIGMSDPPPVARCRAVQDSKKDITYQAYGTEGNLSQHIVPSITRLASILLQFNRPHPARNSVTTHDVKAPCIPLPSKTSLASM
jgi:hypothetical protein